MVGYRNMKNITGSPSSRSPQSRLTENRIAVKLPHRSIYGYMWHGGKRGQFFPGFMRGKLHSGSHLQSRSYLSWPWGMAEEFSRWEENGGNFRQWEPVMFFIFQSKGNKENKVGENTVHLGAAENLVTPYQRTGRVCGWPRAWWSQRVWASVSSVHFFSDDSAPEAGPLSWGLIQWCPRMKK